MKTKDRITDSLVDNIIQNRQPGKVTVDSKGLIHLLTQEEKSSSTSPQWPSILKRTFLRIKTRFPKIGKFLSWFSVPVSKGMLLVMLLLTVLGLLTYIIRFAVNVINDVILYETEYYINEQGTFNPRKSITSDYALFIFNTSEVWANPGIQIHKGDRVRINISGGFNSSIKEVYDGSLNNHRIKYPWVYVDSKNHFKDTAIKEDTADMKFCLARDLGHTPWYKKYIFWKTKDTVLYDYNYGNILYTYKPESADILRHPYNVTKKELYKWDAGNLKNNYGGDRHFHKTNKSGYLYFAVNDLIFDDKDSDYKSLIDDKYKPIIDYFSKKIENAKTDSIKEIYEDSLENHINKEIAIVKEDPSFFYKDNLGQMLVSVEIMHKPTIWQRVLKPMSTKVFCEFYELGSQLTSGWNILRLIGESLLLLAYFLVTILLRVLVIWIFVYLLIIIYNKLSKLYHKYIPEYNKQDAPDAIN